MKIFGKKTGLRQEIPFGPYICIAAFLVSLYGDEIVNLYLNLFM
jgi:leader peptidase (prepilin peptidase)/N-methyltransferase